MKLEEIKKMVRKVSEERSDRQKKEILDFLKSLYKESIQVIENIPDDTINEIFEGERTSDREYLDVSVLEFFRNNGKAYIEFIKYYGYYGKEDDFEEIEVESEFDIRGFCIKIGINGIREETVEFKCEFDNIDSKYVFFERLADENFLNELFGIFLEFNKGRFDERYINFGVNVKWFEEN